MSDIAKLRIESKGLYEIEVNDKGETIVFDTEDIELPFKLNETILSIEKIEKQIKLQEKVIEKKEIRKKGILTNVDEEYRKLYKKAFSDMRKAMDCFLGEGACQKIFGNRNYVSMWDELLEQLKPHLEKIGILKADTNKLIAEKYGDKDEDVIE